MSEIDERRYVSHCPICDSPLERDDQAGYRCPSCGWDETFDLERDDLWLTPSDAGD